METLVLQVDGMSCTGCEQRISTVLRRVDGVREVVADHATGRVELWVGPELTEWSVLVERIIAGLHCSLCTGTIEKALGRMDGVGTVSVSLTHEQALVDYDPTQVSPEKTLGTDSGSLCPA